MDGHKRATKGNEMINLEVSKQFMDDFKTVYEQLLGSEERVQAAFLRLCGLGGGAPISEKTGVVRTADQLTNQLRETAEQIFTSSEATAPLAHSKGFEKLLFRMVRVNEEFVNLVNQLVNKPTGKGCPSDGVLNWLQEMVRDDRQDVLDSIFYDVRRRGVSLAASCIAHQQAMGLHQGIDPVIVDARDISEMEHEIADLELLLDKKEGQLLKAKKVGVQNGRK